VNKQGQTRLARYYNVSLPTRERVHLEGEIVRRCLSRSSDECSFVEHREYKCAYRRYASLFFIVGADADGEENELALLEFIHCVVETLDRRHGNVCELDIMMHLDDFYCILDEMVMNGEVVEVNKKIVLEESGKYDPGTALQGKK